MGGRAQDPRAALQLQGEHRAPAPAWGGAPWTPGGSDLATCFLKGLNHPAPQGSPARTRTLSVSTLTLPPEPVQGRLALLQHSVLP